MTTRYITHPIMIDHRLERGYQHPERPERIQAVWDLFKASGVLSKLDSVNATEATREQIARVHNTHLIDTLNWIESQERTVMIDQDTYALPQSPQIARLAAGGAIQAVDAVITGQVNNALVAVRPPGHHATPTQSMGFCLLNNIAIGARHALSTHNLTRVMIVDFDVHHGNGTQDAFYEDDQVLFISTHQYPFYPGTGAIREIGSGKGEGYTINVALPEGTGDQAFTRILQNVITPAAQSYQPELIMVSAGFDAHFSDPLANFSLSHTGFMAITQGLIQLANSLCDGKIIFVMEGGYDTTALAHGMLNVAYALLGENQMSDPYGLSKQKEPDIARVLDELKAIHHLLQ